MRLALAAWRAAASSRASIHNVTGRTRPTRAADALTSLTLAISTAIGRRARFNRAVRAGVAVFAAACPCPRVAVSIARCVIAVGNAARLL